MASRHTRLNRAIWDNDEFRALTPSAKLLYLHLISSPKISMIGALDHTPGRWSLATGLERCQVGESLLELEKSRFVLVDHTSEEVVVRTFVRHDVQTTNPKMAAAVWSAWSQMGSPLHRRAILDEIPDHAWDRAPEAAHALRGTQQERPQNEAGSNLDRRSTPDPLPPPSPTSIHPPPSSAGAAVPQRQQSTPKAGEEGSEQAIESVLQAIADHQRSRAELTGRQIANPGRWRSQVIRNARLEHLEEIRRLVGEYPTAPASMLAGRLLGQPTPHLSMYRAEAS